MQPLIQTEKVFTLLVKEINQLMNEDVILTNEQGIIVASTEIKRINDFHEGAFLALQKKETIIMTEELSEKLQGVRKGIVLPIMLEKRPIGVLGITGDPIKVESYAQIVRKMAELFIHGTVDQMTQEKLVRNVELFVVDWINGSIPDELLLERGDFFNIKVNQYQQVITLHVPLTTNLSYKEIEFLRTLWDEKKKAIFVRWGQGKILIIDTYHERKWLTKKINTFLKNAENHLEKEVYVGIGQPTNYKHLSTSFEQAERASVIARKEKRIVFEEELRFEMLQYELDTETKEKFMERTIAPIQKDPILLHTLRSWFENNMAIQATSDDLHIHKNTLYYRLEKIEQLTNIDVKKIDNIVLLYIADQFLREINKDHAKP